MVGRVEEREWEWNQEELTAVLENLVDGRDEITYEELLFLLPEAQDNQELLEALVQDLAAVGVSVTNDEEADDFLVNEFGTQNCVLDTAPGA